VAATFLDLLDWGLAVAANAGTMYQLVAAILVGRFAAKAQSLARQCPPVSPVVGSSVLPAAGSDAGLLPPVSMLKPLCGDEPGLEANLRSFCRQDYPDYQVVFGVHAADDPAMAVAEALRAEMPDRVSVVVGKGRPDSGNPKIANLIDLLPAARHDVLLLSDSDIKVGPDHLATVVAALMRPGVGVATCLYVGIPDAGLWSRLGAMGVNHGFLPSVLVAQALGRDDGCFGATIALRRATLDSFGGFESLREQLADDYLLGAAVRAQGQRIGLARCLPQTVVHEPDLATLFAHEVRWGRTLASIEGPGYIASLITLPVPFALLGFISGSGFADLATLAAAVIGRMWAVRSEESSLGIEPQPVWQVVARDVLSFAVQVVALAGRTVHWRGKRYRIGRRGTLVPIGESPRR